MRIHLDLRRVRNAAAGLLLLLPALAVGCGTSPGDAAPTDRGTPASRAPESDPTPDSPMSIYDLQASTLEGESIDLAQFRGKVTLVVNVASECGYTPQYAGLQALHDTLQDRGFAVLGFPSNEFGGQEPGDAAAIRKFCTERFAVGFPMFAKVQTKAGEAQSPIYAALGAATGSLPSWNFCKYLIGRDGNVIAFFPSRTAPDDPALRAQIDAAL